MAMDLVFYFHFYDHTKDALPSRSLAFYIANLTFNTPRDWDELERKIAYCAKEMTEKYGEPSGVFHGWSPDAGLLGVTSTGFDELLQDQVMDGWRSAFVNNFTGGEFSEVFDITYIKDDAQIFSHVKQAYEHQQAQQLRETLNAHITTSASPTTIKKI